MSTPELKNYIKEARKTGMNDEQIIKTLADVGWQVRDVIEIVAEKEDKLGEPIIVVNELSKYYGSFQALDRVSLTVRKGGVTALLGPNGAGKTTLLRILTTLLKPTSGNATIAGFDVVRDSKKLRSVIGVAGQYAAVDEILTGRENLEMVCRLYHMSKVESKNRTNELLEQFKLEDAGDRILKTYSGGMRRRLDLAASLVANPAVLFLDEPTTGLDPQSRMSLWNVIRELVHAGTTVLLTTQYLEEADQLARNILVIDHGKIIAKGTPDELKKQVGGDVVELHFSNHEDVNRAVNLISPMEKNSPHIDSERGVVTMTAEHGASTLVNIMRKLDEESIQLSDIMLRRPSLDDVFIKLTGHEAK